MDDRIEAALANARQAVNNDHFDATAACKALYQVVLEIYAELRTPPESPASEPSEPEA